MSPIILKTIPLNLSGKRIPKIISIHTIKGFFKSIKAHDNRQTRSILLVYYIFIIKYIYK